MSVVQIERQFRALEVKEKELRRKERLGISARGVISRYTEGCTSPRSNAGIIADILHDMHVERKARVGNVAQARGRGPARPRSAGGPLSERGPGPSAPVPGLAARPATAGPRRAVPTVQEALGDEAARNFLQAFTYRAQKPGARTFAPAPRRAPESPELSADDAENERGDGVEWPRYLKSLGAWEDYGRVLQERVNEAEDVPHEPVGRSDFAEILAAPSLTFQDTCRGEIAADLADLEAELAAESVDDGSFGMAVPESLGLHWNWTAEREKATAMVTEDNPRFYELQVRLDVSGESTRFDVVVTWFRADGEPGFRRSYRNRRLDQTGYVIFKEPCSTTLNCCSEFMVLAPRDLYRTYVRVQIYAVAPVRTRALQFVVRFDETSHSEPPPPPPTPPPVSRAEASPPPGRLAALSGAASPSPGEAWNGAALGGPTPAAQRTPASNATGQSPAAGFDKTAARTESTWAETRLDVTSFIADPVETTRALNESLAATPRFDAEDEILREAQMQLQQRLSVARSMREFGGGTSLAELVDPDVRRELGPRPRPASARHKRSVEERPPPASARGAAPRPGSAPPKRPPSQRKLENAGAPGPVF